jgi:hypothetical protein
LCMFHPLDHPMERGWVGRIHGDKVVHLAAQTLQTFFTGGGSAREHAEYPLVEVCLLAPVLHPPAVRIFENQDTFAFANPAAVVGPRAEVVIPASDVTADRGSRRSVTVVPRVAGVVGASGSLAGFTAFAEWRADLPVPKDRDFALGLGPIVVTSDELDPTQVEVAVRVDGQERLRGPAPGFDWRAGHDLAAEHTVLRPGDLVVAPGFDPVEGLGESAVQIELVGVGVLEHVVVGD